MVFKRKSSLTIRLARAKKEKIEESVPSFPHLEALDIKLLPRYSDILHRTDEQGVAMEDLDTLQLELETLLTSVAIRVRTLQKEIKVMSGADKESPRKPEKRKGVLGRPRKIQSSDEYQIVDTRVKEPSGKRKKFPSSKISKLKHIRGGDGAHAPRVTVLRNDVPNRFWAALDSYCGDMKEEDLQFLDTIIEQFKPPPEYLEIPPLGRHYTERWLQEDMKEQCNPPTQQRELKRSVSISHENTIHMRRRSDRLSGERSPEIRLVHTLGEINNVTRKEHLEAESKSYKHSSARHKREEIDDPDDEILAELKRCQSKLKDVAAHNQKKFKHLRQLAAKEMERQETYKKLRQSDEDTREAYRLIAEARQKRIVPPKNDVDFAWKAIHKKSMLLKDLGSSSS